MDFPAEVYDDDGKLMIALNAPPADGPWEFGVAEFLEAIAKAIKILGY